MSIEEVEALYGAPFILGMRVGDDIELEPPRDQVVPAGAVFALMGHDEQITRFRRDTGLELKANVDAFVEILNPSHAGSSEVVIPPGSSALGKTIAEIGMRKRYRAHVLAVYRESAVIRHNLPETRLHVGDTLALHSRWDDLHALSEERVFVVVTDFPYEITRPHKVLHALAFFSFLLL